MLGLNSLNLNASFLAFNLHTFINLPLMPSFVATDGDITNTDHYHLSTTSTIQEERLQEIVPSLQQSLHPLSPPADNIFNFPPLLDFLSDQGYRRTMPPLLDLSDEENPFASVSDLEDEEYSDTIRAISSPLKHREDTEQPDLTVRSEDGGSVQTYDNGPDDTIDVNTYSFDNIICEARAYYGSDKPEFCIGIPDHTTKTVLLSDTDTKVDLKLIAWDRLFGFWVLDDSVGDRYILKCQGGKYYTWQGIDEKWSIQAVACSIQTGQKKTRKAKAISPQSHSTSSVASTRSSSLRTRTATQTKPYTVYNARKKYESKGMSLSDAQLAEVVNGMPVTPARKISVNIKKREQADTTDSKSNDDCSWSILSETSGQSTNTPSLSVSDDEKMKNTTLRTRFNGFDIATIPLPAHNCVSNDVFFSSIKKKWAFQLAKRQIAYCVASFPWLKSDRNILLQETDDEAFLSVLSEIKRAPGWREGTTEEVVIQIYVE